MLINAWVNNVHTTAKTKGWWEKPRTEEEICMLFVSEIAEATECARNGEPGIHFGQVDSRFDQVEFMKANGYTVEEANAKLWLLTPCERFNKLKPEGEAIEIVDLLIRLGDWIGHNGWNLAQSLPVLETTEPTFGDVVKATKKEFEGIQLTEEECRPLVNHFALTTLIVDASQASKATAPIKYADVFVGAIGYMVQKGWNVEEAIEMKMAYNEKRPYRHGGKLA